MCKIYQLYSAFLILLHMLFCLLFLLFRFQLKRKKKKKSIIILLCDLIHALSDSVIQNVDPVLTDDLVHSGCIHMKNNGLETIQR